MEILEQKQPVQHQPQNPMEHNQTVTFGKKTHVMCPLHKQGSFWGSRPVNTSQCKNCSNFAGLVEVENSISKIACTASQSLRLLSLYTSCGKNVKHRSVKCDSFCYGCEHLIGLNAQTGLLQCRKRQTKPSLKSVQTFPLSTFNLSYLYQIKCPKSSQLVDVSTCFSKKCCIHFKGIYNFKGSTGSRVGCTHPNAETTNTLLAIKIFSGEN